MNLYVFIIITTIVQINLCQDFHKAQNLSVPVRKSIFPIARNELKRSNSRADEAKFFEAISEGDAATTTLKPIAYIARKRKNNVDVNFGEIKGLLSKLLDKLQDMERDSNSKREINPKQLRQKGIAVDSTTVTLKKRAKNKKKKRKNKKEEARARWGKWTDWSPCSVSCGKGREIRWRHCLENCEVAETEMEEKTCQLPACGPSKLFGVIKL